MIEYRKACGGRLIGVYVEGAFQFYIERINRNGGPIGFRKHWIEWHVYKAGIRAETLTEAKAKVAAFLGS
jgi:hypothetical protein